ncbi:hypothetical protein BDV93DRAFT_14045 [Ceratobasidium sp. AG-I]|nr:hypothetical protein BDV93DRAFT_14045 [Ceratobasidium sp. AG-I]
MSDDILDEANEAMPYLEKLQDLLCQLRANIIQHLTAPLNAESDSQAAADGNEYDRSLDTQAKIETFLQAYESTLADRLKGLNGQQSLVETQRVARNRTGGFIEEAENGAEPSGLAPQKELENELKRERTKCAFPDGMKPLKLAVRDLVAVRGRSNNNEEVAIAGIEEKRLRKMVSEEEKAMATLQAELVTFRQTFNARIIYYKQLQALSDSVIDVEWTPDELPMLLARCRGQISDEEEELKRAQSKNKYLEFMSKKMSNEAVSKEDRCCQICQTDFESGFITNCGHVFCRECMDAWLKRRHGSCPACRSTLNNNTLHRVDFGATTGTDDEQTGDGGLPVSRTNIEYRACDPKQFAEFECRGQYGEKIQTLVRHLRSIEEQEPGSQSVVFSVSHSLG